MNNEAFSSPRLLSTLLEASTGPPLAGAEVGRGGGGNKVEAEVPWDESDVLDE